MPRVRKLRIVDPEVVVALGRGASPRELKLEVDAAGNVNLKGADLGFRLEKPSVRVDRRGLRFRERDTWSPPGLLVEGVEGLVFDHVDFTGANLEGTRWIDCEFANVKFDRILGFGMNFTNSRIKNCSFTRSDLRRANWGWRVPPEPLVEDCVFEGADLRRTTYTNPLFRRCRFSHCKFRNTRFTARLEECVFEGIVEGVGFGGHILSVVGVPSDDDYSRKMVWNPMRNVDFSRAELRHVAFCNGIDLRSCRLPEGDYLRIPRPDLVYRQVLERVRATWAPGAGREKVIRYLEQMIHVCWKPNQPQPFDFVRRADFIKSFGDDAGRRLLEEVTQVSKQQDRGRGT